MMRRAPMKRSGFARKGFTGNNLGLRVVDDVRVRVLPRLERVPAPSAPVFCPCPKQLYVRDEAYRRFVASLPCFACGCVGRSQAAHSNQGASGKGLSIKASDEFLFPLCADGPLVLGCHSLHDRCIGMTNDERVAREATYLERMDAINNERTER